MNFCAYEFQSGPEWCTNKQIIIAIPRALLMSLARNLSLQNNKIEPQVPL